MVFQSLYEPEPLKCWHCKEPHSTSQDFCVRCNGWTRPTRVEGNVLIDWRKFVIVASDSEEAKRKLKKDTALAIEDNKDVAILGIQIGRDHFGQETEKKAVFRHRAGDKRLSFSNSRTKQRTSSRWWNDITDSDSVWEDFKQLVGEVTTIVTYSCKNFVNILSKTWLPLGAAEA